MSAVITEPPRSGAFLISEGNGYVSRDQGKVAAGQGKLDPGTVMARLSATGEYVVYDDAGADGSETAVAVLYHGVDASTDAARGLFVTRSAEIHGGRLVWGAGLSAASKTAGAADLAACGLIIR